MESSYSRLHGRSLWFTRLVRLLFAFLVLAILAEIVPNNYATTSQEWLVTQARLAFDFNPALYRASVRYLAVLESAVALLFLMVAVSSSAEAWRFPRCLPALQDLSGFLAFAVITNFVLLFHLFPGGRFLPQWTRWKALPGLAGAAAPAQRQQLNWAILGLAVWLSSPLPTLLAEWLLPNGWDSLISTQAQLVTLALVPMTIGFSNLRYRLWDVDFVSNRALVYGELTGLLGVMYLATIALLQALFSAVSGQHAAVSLVISKLIIAGLIAPERFRLRRFIDRRFCGDAARRSCIIVELGVIV